MLKKFLKEVITISVGKHAEDVVDFMDNKRYVNEFSIAKKLDITINQMRNILYRLSDYGLVSSIRKKDKRKGWYTYFWKIEFIKSLEFLKENVEKKITEMTNQIESRESRTFYICERCNIEFNEESALVFDFTCRECGGIFVIKDNSKLLKELKKGLNKQKNEWSLIEEEIEKERGILEKRKLREINKEKKKVLAMKKTKLAIRKNKLQKKKTIKKKTRITIKKKRPIKKKAAIKSNKKIKKPKAKKIFKKKGTNKKIKPMKKSKKSKKIKKIKKK